MPRADMKSCKAALEASGGAVDAAMAAMRQTCPRSGPQRTRRGRRTKGTTS